MNLEDAQEVLKWCDSYSRMPKLIEIAEYMEFDEWLRAIGDEWTGCDNISEFLDPLSELLNGPGPYRQMMNQAEAQQYDDLPKLVRIYRGCGEHNINGACWSLDPMVAKKFPFQHRYRQNRPLLVVAEVDKEDILAVKLDREEAEVITFFARVISTESLA